MARMTGYTVPMTDGTAGGAVDGSGRRWTTRSGCPVFLDARNTEDLGASGGDMPQPFEEFRIHDPAELDRHRTSPLSRNPLGCRRQVPATGCRLDVSLRRQLQIPIPGVPLLQRTPHRSTAGSAAAQCQRPFDCRQVCAMNHSRVGVSALPPITEKRPTRDQRRREGDVPIK